MIVPVVSHDATVCAGRPGGRPSATVAAMARPLKKPLALLGTLGTMAGIWWFALRPRFRKRH